MDNESFSERLKMFYLKIKSNPTELSREFGYSGASRLTRLNNGDKLPSLEVICDFMQLYPDLNIRWLLLGEGEMWEKPQNQAWNNHGSGNIVTKGSSLLNESQATYGTLEIELENKMLKSN